MLGSQDAHGADFFFFNDTATTEIYTLSLHDALPISPDALLRQPGPDRRRGIVLRALGHRQDHPFGGPDRKSTRLNSSHSQISYAAFCLKKKKTDTDRGTAAHAACADCRQPSTSVWPR